MAHRLPPGLPPPRPARGRGAVSNLPGRFETQHVEPADDGWNTPPEEDLPPLATTVKPEPAASIITRNRSPDIGFEQSINPYRGCEHGCIYCYARPSHAYLNLSPGLDFETQLFYKRDAARLLEAALAAPNYRCSPIALGANTDPYQPIEKEYGVTRSILEVLAKCHHPVTIITKSALVARDVDLLAPMAAKNLVRVMLSVTTLDASLKRTLEPRTSSPAARLKVMRLLSDAGIPVGVLVAPVIPVLTDHELEGILEAAATYGAKSARYVLLRLPHELGALFREWLERHAPLSANRVMARMQEMRGGRDYDARFGYRQRGVGELARLLQLRFDVACRRYGLNENDFSGHDTALFTPPSTCGQQLQLF
jgi:DNA repair photolyase